MSTKQEIVHSFSEHQIISALTILGTWLMIGPIAAGVQCFLIATIEVVWLFLKEKANNAESLETTREDTN